MLSALTAMNCFADFAFHENGINPFRHLHRVALCHQSIGIAIKRQVKAKPIGKIERRSKSRCEEKHKQQDDDANL
jgi:hypothetical protein